MWTHVALGTVRVMRTGGMMGEVVGMAASLCKKYHTDPRGVYEKYNGGINIYVTQLAKSLAKKKSISVYALTYGKGKK